MENFDYRNISIHVDGNIQKENNYNKCRHLLPSSSYPPCYMIHVDTMLMPVDFFTVWAWHGMKLFISHVLIKVKNDQSAFRLKIAGRDPEIEFLNYTSTKIIPLAMPVLIPRLAIFTINKSCVLYGYLEIDI